MVASGGTDDAHGHGLANAERVTDGQCNVADADGIRTAEGNGGQVLQINLQDRKIGLGVAADDFGNRLAAILERHDNLVRTRGHVVVGQQVAFRAHDYGRSQARLHALLFRQVVAEETTELRVVEQRMVGFIVVIDHLGRVQIGHGGGGAADGVRVRHRALLHEGLLRRLLQVHVLAWKPDPLGVALDNQ